MRFLRIKAAAQARYKQHRGRVQTEEKLQHSREQYRNLSLRLQKKIEEERTRISREIHDELGQALTALKMDLTWLENHMAPDQEEMLNRIKSMSSLVRSTIRKMQEICQELRPGVLDDLGLVAAISWQAKEFRKRTGIPCHLILSGTDLQPGRAVSEALFRVFQETLTNIIRHARATEVNIILCKNGDHLRLVVQDNGVGISSEQLTNPNALGLIGIRERIYALNGTVTIKGVPGQGTTISVSVPFQQQGNQPNRGE